MRKTTIKQLASELQLSTSTISRALSDDYQISERTKERVKSLALKRNYTVNKYARNLRIGATKTIGVVICDLNNSFMVQVLNGIHDHCALIGYQFLVMQSKGDFDSERECVAKLMDNSVDGLLISPSFNSSDLGYLNALQERGLPIVLFDRISHQIKTHQVAVDNAMGGRLASKYLFDRGFKNILIISCLDEVFLSSERVNGFVNGLGDVDVNYQLAHCNPTNKADLSKYLETIFIDLFERDIICDAIFATTDTFTTMSIRILKKLALNVPLVGFCNSELSDIFIGQPTRIVQPAYELGTTSVKQLLKLIKYPNQKDYETIYLPARMEHGD
ncbi:Catabolite control protein A [compost metagenome]